MFPVILAFGVSAVAIRLSVMAPLASRSNCNTSSSSLVNDLASPLLTTNRELSTVPVFVTALLVILLCTLSVALVKSHLPPASRLLALSLAVL